MKLSSPYERAVKSMAMNKNTIVKEGIRRNDMNDYVRNLKDELNNQSNRGGIDAAIGNNSIANHFMRKYNEYKRTEEKNLDQKMPKRYTNTNDLTPIGEKDSSCYMNSPMKSNQYSHMGIYNNQIGQKHQEDYYQKEQYDHSMTSYRNWVKYSIQTFKMSKLLSYNHIDLYTLNTTEIVMPLVMLLFFIVMMIIKGKIFLKVMYVFVIFLPLLHHFLMNQLIVSLMKCKSHMKKIPLVKSVTFFYTAFIPICFSIISTFILRERSYVISLCLMMGVTYSAFLNEKYHFIYCGIDINTKVLLFINLVLYSFFILLILSEL